MMQDARRRVEQMFYHLQDATSGVRQLVFDKNAQAESISSRQMRPCVCGLILMN